MKKLVISIYFSSEGLSFSLKIKYMFEQIKKKYLHFSNLIKYLENYTNKYLRYYNFIGSNNTLEKVIGDYVTYNKEIELEQWPISIFLVLSIVCFTSSALYHSFNAYSDQANRFFSRLDYAGISLIITGSCIPPYYYIYYCSITYRLIYIGFITICSATVFIFALNPNFANPKMRKVRAFLFGALALAAFSPLIHLFFFFNPNIGMIDDPILYFWIAGGLLYFIGVAFYLSRLPERQCPGTFDLLGSSHQIWHIFVNSGMLMHYFGCIGAYYDRLQHECPSI